MSTQLAKKTVDIGGIYIFLKQHATAEELAELGKVVKCKSDHDKGVFAWTITKKLYAHYQTPVGYRFRSPTLDDMCDKIAKKLKLRELTGQGWRKLHSLSVNTLEKLLKNMPKEEKDALLRKMWDSLDDKKKAELNREYKLADVNEFLHSSEFLVAHVMGVYMAREMAFFTASTLARVYLGSELALTAGKVLTRGAIVILGPLGWALLALSINDLMGTNFKRVVPALLIVNMINERVNCLGNSSMTSAE